MTGEPSRTDLFFETQTYLLRPLSDADISEEWGNWLADSDNANLLNAPCKALSHAELADYLLRFTNEKRVLLGIFHKPTGQHIGLFTSTQSDRGDEVLWNALIGAKAYRTAGSLLEIRLLRVMLGNYFFFTCGYRAAYASVVSHNTRMLQYLDVAGWKRVSRSQAPSRVTGQAHVELIVFRLSKDDWIRREGFWSVPLRGPSSPEA